MGSINVVSIVLKRGAKLDKTYKLTDKKGTPINLSAYVARVEVRPKAGSATVLASLDETGSLDGTTTVTGLEGLVNLFVAADVSPGFAWDHGLFDIRMVNPSDAEDSFFLIEDGVFDMKPASTQI